MAIVGIMSLLLAAVIIALLLVGDSLSLRGGNSLEGSNAPILETGFTAIERAEEAAEELNPSTRY
jgi:hypothetical protein